MSIRRRGPVAPCHRGSSPRRERSHRHPDRGRCTGIGCPTRVSHHSVPAGSSSGFSAGYLAA